MSLVLALLPPLFGATLAFLLNRGTAARRSRARALENLQIVERSRDAFGPGSPLVDQLHAQARTSVRSYLARSSKASQWLVTVAAGVVVLLVSLVWILITDPTGDASTWWYVVGGIAGGLAGILTQDALSYLGIKVALKNIPDQLNEAPRP